MKEKQKSESFLIAFLLALVGGYLDAYTYCCRDKVFANAQTGNIVRLGMTLANGEFIQTIRYFIPIIAFSLGILVAMYIRNKNSSKFHWRQIVLLLEIVIIIIVSFIPINYITNVVANVFISFVCAMQAESFRKVLGQPFSSTMCTGNLRSGTECLYHAFAKKNFQLLKNTTCYLLIIISFILGAFLGVHITSIVFEKAVLMTLIPFIISIWNMFYQKKSMVNELNIRFYIVSKLTSTVNLSKNVFFFEILSFSQI